MARFSGKVGYAVSVQTAPGVYTDDIVEKQHFGDVIQTSIKFVKSNQGANDNITMSNTISIVADAFAINNCHRIKYVWYLGIKWKVTNIVHEYPRLKLILGDEYNG